MLNSKENGNEDKQNNTDNSNGGSELQSVNGLDTEDGEEDEKTLDNSYPLQIR